MPPPPEKAPFYDPIPPTYDEALASGSRGWAPPARDPADQRGASETESQSLLRRPGDGTGAPGSSRRPHGYHQSNEDSDDEGVTDWGSDSDSSEADQVRREMEEMDIEEPNQSLSSTWRKRLRLPLSLPSWKWSWRPSLPRFRIQLPSRPTSNNDETNNENEESAETNQSATTIQLPKINGMVLALLFARILALFIILGFFWFLFTSGLFTGLTSPLTSGMRFNAEDVRNFVQQRIEPMRMRASVMHYSSYAHMAGTEGDYATAMDVHSMFKKAHLDEVVLGEYQVYINYPREDGRTVQIFDDSGENTIWTANLEEDERHQETAGHQTFAFHGYSKSGDVKGPLIYVNYGSQKDYQLLKDKGIDTNGAIALVRYYGSEPDAALKVKLAEKAGFAGCLIYSDPTDDGFVKGQVAPDGRYMPKDGVQRASVALSNFVMGDPLTPGWGSIEDQPRMKVEEAPGLPQIPSLPLAWRDAQVLLQHLKGHGEKVEEKWQGEVPEVGEWWTGNLSSPVVRLQNEQDEIDKQRIWNVYGQIEGMEQTKKAIILGNHRDSWAFGATNPHTGTAIMIELARIFGDLLDRGWRPLRTIQFMSWDAAEYNMVGSTEYVESHVDALRQDAFAYIDLDGAITGTDLTAGGSPVFKRTLLHAMGRVVDPVSNETLRMIWERDNKKIQDVGSVPGDYTPFLEIAGTSSLHLSFNGERYPYHSSYDNFDLVENVIDPDFAYHTAMAQVVGLIMLDLADRAIMPFDMAEYGDRLVEWTNSLEVWTTAMAGDDDNKLNKLKSPFQELKDAAALIKSNVEQFANWEMTWEQAVMSSGSWESNEFGAARLAYNEKMAAFETTLLDVDIGGGVSLYFIFLLSQLSEYQN